MYFGRLFLLFSVLTALLYPTEHRAADNCAPSDFSVSLDASNSSYSNSGNIARGGSDTYYVSVAAAGTVTVTVSSRSVLFSYSQNSCPAAGDPPASQSATYSFTGPADFNLRLYRGRRGGGRRGGSYTVNIEYTPLSPIAEYRMDECGWSGVPGEVEDSIGGDSNGTVTGGGADTTDSGMLCRAGIFSGDAVDIDNLEVSTANGEKTTVMFWIYWDGTNSVMPFGWDIYDLWFYNGNFGFNTGNGDIYGISSSGLANGWHHVAAVFTNGDVSANRLYIDGAEQTLTQSLSSPDNSRAVVQSSARIGGWLRDGGYRFRGNIDELKIYNGEVLGADIKSIYDNESAGKNYDGTQRSCADCSRPPVYKNGTFNAVDYTSVCSAVSNWDDNITTKVAGSAYSLSILSKEEATGLPMEANITRVDLYRYSSGDTAACSGAPYSSITLCSGGCGFTDAAGCMRLDVPSSANDRAAKCVEVHIEGKDLNDTASASLKESNSSDDFAVRPDTILFLQPEADANLTAERSYLFTSALKAVLSDGTTAAPDYNTSLTPIGVKYMRNGEQNSSLAGTLSSSPSAFADGSADLNVSFGDVAIVSIRFNDVGWASVDSDDTPPQSRRIYGERNVTFIPKRFDLQFLSAPTMEDNDTANRFTYISNDLNMSAWARSLTVVVTAVGEKSSTMKNFSNPSDRLFADPVDISPLLNLPAKHSVARYTAAPSAQSGADIGFDSGEAFVNYADVPFNYDRSFDTPLDPFFISGSEANISVTVTDSRYPAVGGSIFSVFDGNATFYYGRLRADDVITTQPSVEKSVEIEVYDSSGSALVSDFRQNSLRWFRNKKHTGPSSGRIAEANVTLGLTLDSGSDTSVSIGYSTFGSGFVVMELNNTSGLRKSRTVHMGVESWLWYAPRGFGLPYSYAPSSDCASHPCFLYSFEVKGSATGVASGDFNGSDFDTGPIDANATIRRKEGVKLFR